MGDRRSESSLLLPGLGVAVLAISSAATFVRVADPLDSTLIAGLRVTTTGAVLLLLSLGSTREAVQACLRDRALAARVLLGAFMLALHFGTWIASLTMTSIVRSVALVSTQPIFAGFLGRLTGDRAPGQLYLGAAVAITGTVIMATASSHGPGPEDQALLGDILALVGAFAAAAYLTVGRVVSERIPLRGYLVLLHLLGGLMLLVVALILDLDWAPAGIETTDYLAVLYLGLVPGIIGHGLLNWAVRRIPVHVVALTILLEPLGAAVIAWAALGEHVTGIEALGAGVLLLGIGVGVRRKSFESG